MKNRMDVPQEYEPVLPGKVEAHLAKKKAQAAENSLLTQTAIAVGKAEAHLAKKKAQAAENSLLTQTAIAVGKAIAQLRPVSFDTFDVRDLSPDELRDLKSACVNHLSHLIPGIEKESIDD